MLLPKHTFLTMASMLAIVSTSAAAVEKAEVRQMPVQSVEILKEAYHGLKSQRKAPGFVGSGSVFFEMFEYADPDQDPNLYPLPAGWTTTPTPGYSNDYWHSGSLIISNSTLYGVSNVGMGYILVQTNDHDSWAFSPAISLEAGVEYTVSYWVLMLGSLDDTVYEDLTVCIGNAPEAVAMTTQLGRQNEDILEWERYAYKFCPEETGDYYIGFHATSPAWGNAIIIDDVSVATDVAYWGAASMQFAETYDLSAAMEQNYLVGNHGSASLTLELKSSSPEIKVEGLPLTLRPGRYESLPVTLNVNEAGEYTGSFTLATNDPSLPEVTVEVKQTVNKVNATGYWREDFEDGFPLTWTRYVSSYPQGHRGVNKSQSIALSTQIESYFITDFTFLGNAPVLSFSYEGEYENFETGGLLAIPTESAQFLVEISDNGGMTWNPVYNVNPEDNPHDPTMDFKRVSVDLSAYANKVCQVRFSAETALIYPYYFGRWNFDDIELGTVLEHNLAVRPLRGNSILTVGQETKFEAQVRNYGQNEEQDVEVQIIDQNGAVLAVATLNSLAAGADQVVEISWIPAEEYYGDLRAQVALATDQYSDDNVSAGIPVRIVPDEPISVTIGTATARGYLPWDLFDWDSETESIYSAEDMGTGPATIYGITLFYNANGGLTTEPVELYIGSIDGPDFSDLGVMESGLRRVYYDGLYMADGDGEVYLPFSEPYLYDGGHLVLYAKKNHQNYVDQHTFYLEKTEVPKSVDGGEPYYYRPVVEFCMSNPPKANISGMVKCNEQPVQNAKVSVLGTGYASVTDSNGEYSFDVLPGSYTLLCTAYGYKDTEVVTETLVENQSYVIDIDIEALSLITVSGKVVDSANGQEISGALIQLSGYADYSTHTDADGTFKIENVYAEIAQDYDVKVTAPYYYTLRTALSADSEVVTLELNEKCYPVASASCYYNGAGNAVVTWEEPQAVFRYDSGILDSSLGFDDNDTGELEYAVLGNAFGNASVVRSISWYTDSYGSEHPTVDVFLFPLDQSGIPSAAPAYHERIENTDDVWMQQVLSKPIAFDYGFLVAISSEYGNVSIGTALPTAEYPLADAWGFYNAHYEMNSFHDYYSVFTEPMMIRAAGDDLGTVNPVTGLAPENVKALAPVGYNVYRMPSVDSKLRKGELIAEGITELTFVDSDPSVTSANCYAIVAIYPGGESEDVRTNILANSGIATIDADQAEDEAVYYRLDGIRVDGRNLSSGIYIRLVNGQAQKMVIP
ncbi:MAG: carboxypeptidase-like regulatory domain-containing protein [Bacteroidales bacterium]|nr:carboxypeptidase-like regulatory domain-containing protein [Bacteroidales bacterium]